MTVFEIEYFQKNLTKHRICGNIVSKTAFESGLNFFNVFVNVITTREIQREDFTDAKGYSDFLRL